MPVVAHGGDPDRALQQQREFYEWIGRAIGQWAFIEQNLWHTYRRIIEPGDLPAAASGFHAVINLTARLDVIHAAISTSRKYQDRTDEWNKLHRKIRQQSARRARLSHWTPTQVADSNIDPGGPMFLEPPIYDFTKFDVHGDRERIDIRQVRQWCGAFAKLAVQIDDFWRSLITAK